MVIFFDSGHTKLLNIEHFADSLQSMSFPFPVFQAYLAGLTELIGGLCLMLGFASRLVSIPLAIVMLMAYFTVHIESLKSLFTNPSLFVAKAPFNFLLTTLIILAFGPGRFSVDYLLEKMFFKKA